MLWWYTPPIFSVIFSDCVIVASISKPYCGKTATFEIVATTS